MTTTPPAPTVTSYGLGPPSPYVEIVMSPIPPDAWTWTVWRNAQGQPRTAVRGAFQSLAAAGYATDFEAPFDRLITYTIETADALGEPSELSPPSTPVVLSSPDMLWLSDPLNPSSAEPISLVGSDGSVLLNTSLAEITYGGRSTILPITGSALPVASSDVRIAPAGVEFVILTPTLGGSAHLRELLTQAAPFLARGPALLAFLSGAAYMAADDVVEHPYRDGASVWSFAADTVRAPTSAVIVEPRTWDDVLDEAGTWNDVLANNATWLDVLRGNPGAREAAA